MIPIRDSIPSRIPPLVTWSIILVNVIVFAFELTLGKPELERLFYNFGVVPASLRGMEEAATLGLPLRNYWTLLTSTFLHGGLLHIGFNMWTLWIFGNNVEDRMGHIRYLIFYLLAGAVSGGIHALFNADSLMPTIGASGAIAGVLGAYFFLYPFARVIVLVPIIFIPYFFQVPAFLYLGVWFVMQILSGSISLGVRTAQTGGVAWWAHVGGFGAGILLHRLFLTRCEGRPCPDEYDLDGAWGSRWEERAWRSLRGGRR